MHKLTILYWTSSNPDHFRRYYVETHIPLVEQMPGIARMNYSFGLESLGPDPAPFCLFEAWFESAEAMGAASASPEGQKVTADVANFAEGPPLVFHGPVSER